MNPRFSDKVGISRHWAVMLAAVLVGSISLALLLQRSTLSDSEESTAFTPPHSARGDVLWRADYETGDDSQWDRIAISGKAESTIVTSPVRSGRYANSLTVYDANGADAKPGVRMVFKNKANAPEKGDSVNLPNEGYYSAWYYIPVPLTVAWLNVHQWKQQYNGSARKLYSATLYNDEAGELVFRLATSVDENGEWRSDYNRLLGHASAPVPIGEWFHLESYYRWDDNGDGRITTWLDGEEIWDISGLTTAFAWPFETRSRQWAVNNYANDTTPSTFSIYVDDVAVATSRLGPG